MTHTTAIATHYLFASDFDQTLSFNDSGSILSELIGSSGFDEKVAALPARISCTREPSSRICFATTPSSEPCGAIT